MKLLPWPALALAACATVPRSVPVTTAEVRARAETEAVATRDADAADDPANWVNGRNPRASLIVATDKRAGLNVYGLDGRLRSSFPAGRVNNVDLRVWRGAIVVAASDRNDRARGKLALFRLDPATASLVPLGTPPVGQGEAYGVCLTRRAEALYAFVVMKEGAIVQLRVDPAAGTAVPVRTMRLASQSEGCVVDDRTGRLFVAEEDVGIWRFDAAPDGPTAPVAVARVDGARLFADVEGLALAPSGRAGGYLVASSQGDNSYALWRLPDLRYAGRFRIGPGVVDGASETDGIEVTTTPLPGYPGGMMIAQDGDNAPEAQNSKLVAWRDVLRAIARPRRRSP